MTAVVAFQSHRPRGPRLRTLDALLSSARIIDHRTTVLGYQRDKFGHGWGRSPTPHGVWCTTRQHVLREQLDDIRMAPTATCDIISGHGIDPYTGRELSIASIDIDHIVPLSAAWDLGAATWTRDERIAFANDRKRNLVATDSRINREKSDGTPDEWMPPNHGQGCWYATAYAHVTVAYDLALTRRDVDALRQACT